MRYALEKYGLDPSKDVSILQLGNVPHYCQHWKRENPGAMLSAPTTLRAKKLGYPMLADLDARPRISAHRHSDDQIIDQEQPELLRFHVSLHVEESTTPKLTAEKHWRFSQNIPTDDKEILMTPMTLSLLIWFQEKPYPTLKGIQSSCAS
jgi:hypothetical protein